MTEFVHAFRPSIMSGERSYRLGPNSLIWKDERQEDSIGYGEIAKVNINSMAPPFGQAQSRCVLHPRSGGKIVLSSGSYQRFGVIEDRAASYAPLVRELLTRIAVANPNAIFTAGQPRELWWLWLVLLIASVLILLGGLALALMGQFPLPAAAAFMIVLAGIPVGWRVVRHGRPQPLDPRAPPEDQLHG
ncbi:MAG TPA: hypothetical protein VIY51_25505 [Xanthobacteraceae bacterium]